MKRKEDVMILKREDMNKRSLCLFIGQRLEITGRRENGDYFRKKLEIIKFYKNHVMCKVNGTRRECFTYNELSQLAEVRNGVMHGYK